MKHITKVSRETPLKGLLGAALSADEVGSRPRRRTFRRSMRSLGRWRVKAPSCIQEIQSTSPARSQDGGET